MLTGEQLERFSADSGLSDASIVVRRLHGTVAADAGSDAATGTNGAESCPERALYPASMIKLPIALALADLYRSGALRPQERATVGEGDATANDLPSPYVPGYSATLADYAHAMLAASDNVATNVLIDVARRERITSLARARGLAATAVRRKLSGALPLIDDPQATGRNAHPAGDAARLLGIVARRAARGPDFIYDALLAQRWNDKLSAGLDPGDTFAHKTGDTDEVSHDGGILTLPDGRRYIVVVYTALPSTPHNDARFAAFARMLRRELRA